MMVAFFYLSFIFIYPLHDRVKEEDYFASLSSDVVSLVSYCCLWNLTLFSSVSPHLNLYWECSYLYLSRRLSTFIVVVLFLFSFY